MRLFAGCKAELRKSVRRLMGIRELGLIFCHILYNTHIYRIMSGNLYFHPTYPFICIRTSIETFSYIKYSCVCSITYELAGTPYILALSSAAIDSSCVHTNSHASEYTQEYTRKDTFVRSNTNERVCSALVLVNGSWSLCEIE